MALAEECLTPVQVSDTEKGDDLQIIEIMQIPQVHPPDAKSPKKSKKGRRHRDLTPVKEGGDALDESIYQQSQEQKAKGKRIKEQSESGDMLFGDGKNSQVIKQSLKQAFMKDSDLNDRLIESDE